MGALSKCGRKSHYFLRRTSFHAFGQIQESQHQWSVGLQKLRQGNTIAKINGEDGNKIADLAHLYPCN